MWDLETGQCRSVVIESTGYITSVSITPDGHFAVSGSYDNTLQVWSLKTSGTYQAELVVSLPKGFDQRQKEEVILKEAIRNAEELYEKEKFNQSFTMLYNAWKDTRFSAHEAVNKLYFRLMKYGRINSLSHFFQKKLFRGHERNYISMFLSTDGGYEVFKSFDKTLQAWNLETGKTTGVIIGNFSYVTSVSLTSKGRYPVLGIHDKTLKMWDLKTGQCLQTLEDADPDTKVFSSADGRYAICGSGFTVQLWCLETGQCLRTINCDISGVLSVSFTPDGRYALLAGLYSSKMWDLETGQCLYTLIGDSKDILSWV